MKPENVLIDRELDNTLKIIDFSNSSFIKSGEDLNITHGTSYYIAPEVLKKKYTEKCDVWSVGVILYILLSGKPPFDGDNDEEITEQVKMGAIQLKGEAWEHISKPGKSMIKKMLTIDSRLRITAKEALQDPWFAEYAEKRIVEKEIMQEILGNMYSFGAVQKLQQATMSMMV